MRQSSVLNLEILRKFNAKFCLHFSCLAFAKDFRGKDNIAYNMISRLVEEVFNNGGVCTAVSNFRQTDRFWYSLFPEQTTLEDQVKYVDNDLTLEDGTKPLRSLEHLGGIQYFSLNNRGLTSGALNKGLP